MTKHEFLNLLEQRLIVLNDDERADLLNEYEQHIEMKMQSGLSEEEAIADFGDPEELTGDEPGDHERRDDGKDDNYREKQPDRVHGHTHFQKGYITC